MAHEIAIIPFPHPVPLAKLQEIITDFTNPDVSRGAKVLSERTEPPDLKRGLWYRLCIQVPSGDVANVERVIQRYEAIRRIGMSALMPLG